MTPYRFYEYSRNQGLIGSRKVIKGPCETTFNMSSSSFKINFCCSSTFEVSSAILFSASSRRLVFSDILTFKNRTYKPVTEDKDALKRKELLKQKKHSFQHPNQIPTFSCVSSCSILRFLSRSNASSLLISSPLVASSQSSASMEL